MTAVPRTTHAAYITELGPAEAIRYGELPIPALGPTDVLVHVAAVAVNPVDTFVRSGGYRTPIPFPFIIGRDLVGTVAAVGNGVTGFAVGDQVWCNSLGHRGRQGSFAEYALVSEERLYPLPAGVDPVAAVAVLHPAVTAYLGLFRHANLRPGETIYVGGGGGNVGTSVIQFAAEAGARVITSARPEDHEWCRRHGASVVLDYRDPELASGLRAAAPAGLDVHFDTSGRADLGPAVDLLAQDGRILLMAGLTRRQEFTHGALYTRNARILGFALSIAGVDELAAAAVAINRGLAAGTLGNRIATVLPLSEAAAAHRMAEGRSPAGPLHGRVVLRCQ